MSSCGCRCAVVLIEEQLHVFQYDSIIYLIRYIFSFSCSYTIHNIPVSQYLEYVHPAFSWCCIHLYLRFFVLMSRPPQKLNMGFLRWFSPPLSLSLSLSTLWVFRFVNDNYRYRYRYRSYFSLIVPKRFWFRYPTLIRIH